MPMIELFKKQHALYKILSILLAIISLVFIVKVSINTVRGLDYPNEILEPANVQLANAFLNGTIPYEISSYTHDGLNIPPANFEYPFLNSGLAALLSIFIGGNTVVSLYIISFLSMVGTAFLGGLVILKESRTTVGAAMGFLLLMFCHWRYGYISGSPDGLGLFITMLVLFLACNSKTRNKGIWCALFTVLLFYTKQYYVAVGASVFIFLLIYSRREALKYLVSCFFMLTTSAIVISSVWPLYWTFSFLCLYHGCFQGWGVDGILNVINQMKYLLLIFGGMVIALLYATIVKYKSIDVKKEKVSSANEMNPMLLFEIQIPIQLLVLFIVGRNDGAYLTYFLQLLIPSLCIATIIAMEQMETHKFESAHMTLYVGLVIFTIYFGWNKLPMHMLSDEEIQTWNRAYALVDDYRGKGNILHARSTAYNGMFNGDVIYGTDHDGDVSDWAYDEYLESDFQRMLFPNAGIVYESNLRYREYLRERLKHGEILMIVMTEGRNMYVNEQELELYGYKVKEEMDLQLGNTAYLTKFWVLE